MRLLLVNHIFSLGAGGGRFFAQFTIVDAEKHPGPDRPEALINSGDIQQPSQEDGAEDKLVQQKTISIIYIGLEEVFPSKWFSL